MSKLERALSLVEFGLKALARIVKAVRSGDERQVDEVMQDPLASTLTLEQEKENARHHYSDD